MSRGLNMLRHLELDPVAARHTLLRHSRDVVCDDPAAGTIELRLHVGGVDVQRRAEITIDQVEQPADGPAGIVLGWQDITHPERFPVVVGVLGLRPTPGDRSGCDLTFVGSHTPPLGPLGVIVDAAVGHAMAEQAVGELLRRVAQRLRDAVAVDVAQRARLDAERALAHHRIRMTIDED